MLSEGQTGFCGVRGNIGGSIDLSVYGRPFGMHVDPIEKKPVLHMYPGTRILSFGTTGCNYACKYCQNFDMSQRKEVDGDFMAPEEVVETAIRLGCSGIAYTYNEPTVFIEFAHDVGLIARKKGLVNIFVTNGYETEEAIEYASDFLDMMTIDFKGNASNAFYRKYISVIGADPIYDTIRISKEKGIHVEITDLVVPEIGDNLEDASKMIDKVIEAAGTDIPISFLRFHPDYKLLSLSLTPVATLEAHRTLAAQKGMPFAYIGNVPGNRYQSTYCPSCGTLAVRRDIFTSRVTGLTYDGRCSTCNYDLNIITA